MNQSRNTLLQVTRYGMGAGDRELAISLVVNYFTILLNDDRLPKIVVFYNEGVRLIAEESPLISIFEQMQAKGVQLIACKTCISKFDLFNSVQVGKLGTMNDIITLQANADKVINL